MNRGIVNVLCFWAFLFGMAVADTYFYSKGYDGFFWVHRTPEEKELQRIAIDKARGECK